MTDQQQHCLLELPTIIAQEKDLQNALALAAELAVLLEVKIREHQKEPH
jgi:hypothetical protein